MFVEVVEHEAHYHQRLFLEAWMSVKARTLGMLTWSSRSLQVLSTHIKLSQITRIQQAQRLNFEKVCKSRISGFSTDEGLRVSQTSC